ncbi:MAG: M1 family metallopeptidase, partial [Kaistella sp.]
MNKGLIVVFTFLIGMLSAQQTPYYQQFAKYKMDIDVDAPNFTYQGNQTLTYTNNSPDELKVVYFHLYWNAFKPGSMMDQRVQNQGKNGDSRLQINGVSRLASIPKDQEGAQNIHWIKQNGKNLKFEIQETIMKVELNTPLKPNSTTTFTMEWDAVIPQQIRRSGRNNREGIDMTMTQWYPKIAEYDYDGWATFDYIGREFHAPFSDYDISIKIDRDYIIGAGGTLENPLEVKGYDAKTNIKSDSKNKATWRWTAKNLLDFAWAADKDYTVEEFTILDGPKVYYVYQKSEKTKLWEESKPYVTKFFQLMNAAFGRYVY